MTARDIEPEWGHDAGVARIARVELYHVAIPLNATVWPAWIPGFPQRELRLTLVRMWTDDGVDGVCAGPAIGRERAGLGELLGPYLLGEDPTDIGVVQQRLREIRYLGWANWWVEPAAWDIAGKLAGQPVWRLLLEHTGVDEHEVPRTVKVYASTAQVRAPEEAAERALAYREAGFDAVKLRVHDFDEARDVAVVRAVREAVGDSMVVGVDANQGWRVTAVADAPLWDLGRAQRFADAAAELDVAWIEEPLAMDDWQALAALRRRSRVPIAGGELHSGGARELEHMMVRRCYDIYQPDALMCGGLAQVARVARLCRVRGLRYTPHTWTSGIGLLVNLHAFAASGFGRALRLEYPLDPPGWTEDRRDALLRQPLVHERGTLAVPDAPGLGLELDERALRRWGRRFFVMDRKRLVWFSLRNRGLRASLAIERARRARHAAAK